MVRRLKYFFNKDIDRHLVLGVNHRIPLAQVDGLLLAQSANSYCIDWYDFEKVEISSLPSLPTPKVVWLQSWWDTPSDVVLQKIGTIRHRWPDAKLIYLDWFAPTDIRNAYLVKACDLYVKKNMLADTTAYEKGFCDTNLVEYEARYSPDFKGTCHGGLSKQLLDEKVRLGWSFATQKRLIKLLSKSILPSSQREIALHCRMAAPKTIDNWYAHMRMRAFNAVKELSLDGIVAESKALPWAKYIEELKHSQMCFSPFGFGEVCWRDFEAVAAGALLIKPDMSHMRSIPNIFDPDENYACVDWEFKDLEPIVRYYAQNEKQRQRKVLHAQKSWVNYLENEHAKYVRDLYA